MVEELEDKVVKMNNRVEDEMQKLEEQAIILDTSWDKIINLTKRIENLENLRNEDLMEVNFEVLKKEIKELEVYISAMKVKPNGNTAQVENLYKEVKNISKTVGQLETLDKNNVLKTKRDMENLKKRLVDCEKNMKPKTPVMVPLGSCQHQGLARIGKPNLLQLNWKGSAYKSGAWGKDAAWNTTKRSLYWVAPLSTDGKVVESVRIYPSLSDMQMYKNSKDLALSVLIRNKWNHTFAGQGAGMVVHNNNLYYFCYNSRDMCRAGLTSGVYQRKPLPSALVNNRVSSAGTMLQSFYFAADEKGLWVIHEGSAGNTMVGKVNVATFTIDNSWTIPQKMSDISNFFMICGVFYACHPVGPNMDEVFFMYDTKTGKEGRLSIMMEKMVEKVSIVSYNSNERKLYSYGDGYLFHQDVYLKP